METEQTPTPELHASELTREEAGIALLTLAYAAGKGGAREKCLASAADIVAPLSWETIAKVRQEAQRLYEAGPQALVAFLLARETDAGRKAATALAAMFEQTAEKSQTQTH